MTDLIDTTEMYLKTIFELEEEGIVPLRARIAERLHQSGPTVSQTVARMERDGLLTVEGDRHLAFTDRTAPSGPCGSCASTGSPSGCWSTSSAWSGSRSTPRPAAGSTSCPRRSNAGWSRSSTTPPSRRTATRSPGLEELGEGGDYEGFLVGVRPLDQVASAAASRRLMLARIGEPIQTDEALMAEFRRVDVLPGRVITATLDKLGMVVLSAGGAMVEIDLETAAHVFVKIG